MVVALALAAGCAHKPPSGADLPLSPKATGEATLHAVHSEELRDIMSRVRGLAFERLPQELESQDRSVDHLQQAGFIARDLAQATHRMTSVAEHLDLTADEQVEFLRLAESLRTHAAELREHASQRRRRALRATMDQVNSTCVQCHELFREPGATSIGPMPILSRQSTAPAHLLDRLRDTNRLSGDWGGGRSILEERGVRLNLFYNELGARKGRGGAESSSTARVSGSSDLIGHADFGRLGLARGGEALIHMKGDWSNNVNSAVGALGDPLDDADSDRVWIDQLWYQHNFRDRIVQLRLGYLDQQTILDRNAFANQEDIFFQHTFQDNNSAIIPLAIGPGAAVFYNPTDWFSLVATVSDAEARPLRLTLDTAFTGKTFTYVEADFRPHFPSSRGPLEGNYRVGYFLDPRDPAFVAAGANGTNNKGAYASFDQMLFAERGDNAQGAGVFARLGWRPSRMNRISGFYSAGAQYAGPIVGRPRDVIGFAFYFARTSDLFREQVNPDAASETGYELYYAFRVAPAITLTPAFQRLQRPGGIRSRPSVSIASLRLRLIL